MDTNPLTGPIRPKDPTSIFSVPFPGRVVQPKSSTPLGAAAITPAVPNPQPAPAPAPEPPAAAREASSPVPAPELVANPWAALEDKADPMVPTATLQIYAHINEALARGTEVNVNRASAASQCFKRRWYQHHGFKGTPLTPRKIANFILGDLAEAVLLQFIREACVGPGKLYSEVDFGEVDGELKFQGRLFPIYRQREERVLMPFVGYVTCHVDGWGKRNADGQWEHIECKSAANWGFNDFKETGPKEYLKQSTTALMTDRAKELGATQTRFFYLRKETGHIWDRLFDFDPRLAEEVKAEYRLVRRRNEPEAPYGLVEETYRKKPTGRLVAQFPCTYCPFLEKCHGPHTIEWKSDQFGHQKPVYVFGGAQ